MRHPHKYGRALKITFSFTYLLDATAAVVGLLMFGDDVMDASKSIEEELFYEWHRWSLHLCHGDSDERSLATP